MRRGRLHQVDRHDLDTYVQRAYAAPDRGKDNNMSSEQQLTGASPSRAARLNIRATAKQDTLIRLAAQATSKTVTEFVLDSASNAADQVLADRRWFLLDDAAWSAFNDSLERRPVAKPRLRELLAEESTVFAED